MRIAAYQNAPHEAATIRFEIDGRNYEAPEAWVARAMRTRKLLGADPNEAAVATLSAWAQKQDQQSVRRYLGLPEIDEGRLLA